MKTRAYSMELRAAAAEATRERVLAAAREAFLEGWYDEVTIASVALAAGAGGGIAAGVCPPLDKSANSI